MSTPVTLKQMEQSKKRTEARKKANNNNVFAGDYYQQYQPLSWSAQRSGGYGYGGQQQLYSSYARPQSNRAPSSHIDFTDDLAVGRQYTSFEHKNKAPKQPRPLASPIKEKAILTVEDAPENVECDEVLIDDEKVVCFNGRQHWLSNLYPSPMTIEGHEYPSVEHYYQACKLYTLGDARLAMQIRRIPDAGNVKVTAKRLLREIVSNEQVEHWKNTKGPLILKHAIVHKFVQNPQLRDKLLATGDSLLAHTYERDRVFATGCTKEKLVEWAKQNAGKTIKIPKNVTHETMVYVPLMGEGKNVLGVISMKVRDQVQQFQKSPRDTADPILAAAMATLKLDANPTEKQKTPDLIERSGESSTSENEDATSSPSAKSKTTKSK